MVPICPLVFQGQEVEAHGLTTVDDFLGGKGRFGFRLIENKGLGTDLKRFVHGLGSREGDGEWENGGCQMAEAAFLGRKGR